VLGHQVVEGVARFGCACGGGCGVRGVRMLRLWCLGTYCILVCQSTRGGYSDTFARVDFISGSVYRVDLWN
jgi:hypothetical protein